MGKIRNTAWGVNAIAMFLLALATWRFHSLINGVIDMWMNKIGITNPLATDAISLSILIIIIIVLFAVAGISIFKLIKGLFS